MIFGPRQIAARINQDQVIAPQITLWNQQGSEVIQGTLLVIPIEESLIYIRPLYLRAAGGFNSRAEARDRGVPEPDRHGGDARCRARSALPGRRAAPADRHRPRARGAVRSEPAARQPPSDLAALAAQARAHYERAMQAQRDGNWALYGEEIKQLGEVLEKMKKLQ